MGHPTLDLERINGFTIVELLAAMVVASLVIAFVLSMYLFSERVMAHREKDTEVKEAVSECVQRIAMDIKRSERLLRCDDTSLVLKQSQIREIKYHFDGSYVMRNTVLVNPTQMQLTAHVSFNDDTTTAGSTRLWNIRIVGWQGQVRDSANVYISTIISSEELVSRSMASGE